MKRTAFALIHWLAVLSVQAEPGQAEPGQVEPGQVEPGQAEPGQAEPGYNRDIRPILSANCFACHGPDEEAREAKLRLDTPEGAKKALGPVDESELIYRIETDDEDDLMPPEDSGHTLTEDQKQKLRQWVSAGAPYEQHWAFEIPKKTEVPEGGHPIDHFVSRRLKKEGFEMSKPADRYALIRRVSLDLTGVPPPLAEADEFEKTGDYEQVVDRLLASSDFGEHWARMWLDLARYADTKGYEKDRPRAIWRYRDWVIEALNADMPYDQFTTEQLAGDLLPDATNDQILATAFHRNTMENDEGGTDNEEFRVAAVKDRVDTTMQVWMGLTMGCAKCHTHKYDPISIEDYYSFYAFFNQTEDADQPGPVIPTPTEEQVARMEKVEAEIKALTDGLEEQPEALADLQGQLKKLRSETPTTPIMRELAPKRQRITKIHQRGNFLDQEGEMTARLPEMFGALPDGAPANRLGVARWLTHPDNPLTARVMVNRVWARLFGVGIVETEEDFGMQGTVPTHQELLDWLAVDYRENGWSLKQLLKTIVMSKTYRQSSKVSPDHLAADPRNRLFTRGPRFRLSAEMVRDQALAASGLLTRKIGGPSVMPPQPPGVWKSTYSGDKWQNATGPDRFRRGVYTYLKRTSPYPTMTTFDGGSGEVCQIRRVRTNTPLQALVTLNDTAFVEAAGALAQRMSDLAHGFRLVLIRPPSEKELARLKELHTTMTEHYQNDPAAAKELLKSAGLKAGDAAMVAVANVLLNLDEALTKP
jgi:mono/diheme cytochrome c family protein